MGLFKRLAGFLGLARDDGHEHREEDESNVDLGAASSSPAASIAAAAAAAQAQNVPRKGFSVPIQVAVEKAPPAPLLVYCSSGDGGVQGFGWYAKSLRIDEDGDVADEFLDEILPGAVSSMEEHSSSRQLPRFEVKYSTTPVKVRNQALGSNGKIQQHVECRGRLQWV